MTGLKLSMTRIHPRVLLLPLPLPGVDAVAKFLARRHAEPHAGRAGERAGHAVV